MSRRGVICLLSFLQRLLGNNNAKEIKKMRAIADHINEIEPNYIKLSDANLVAKTDEFKRRLQKGETLDDLLPEAFAVVREASKRVLGMRHFDVQLMGGICLHNGNIAEMRTGEGKTLVATLPVYLNALTGKGVHVVTVNDYLATRDSEQMGRLYNFLGLSTGLIVANLDFNQRKEAYACDITYGTNNEFGFDYLRDNMVTDVVQMVQRPLNYAIVDEVDSILIDEARTPLIISGPGQRSTDNYYKLAKIVPHLVKDEDYVIDEKQKTATLTEDGIRKLEEILGVDNIYVSQHYNDIHHIENALKAAAVYKRDVDYLVRDEEILIIDEHTGRVLSGRRYSDGLHQAIEAKEGVTIQQESRTLASVTFQNYFRLYKKLSGMTGTAKTEEEEFYKIYSLEVITVPTNRPIARIDRGDLLFRSEKGKFDYIVRLIEALHEKGQPVLVGTVSVAKSEYLSSLLSAKNIPHEVLNAKQDAREADIVSNAGKYGAVTIATNMAGRGTDIKIDDRVRNLDGEVILEGAAGKQTYKLGGLFVIGTEKHETRRIDNQLRGRSGRQGDPGLSQFMISPDDDIMRIFGSNNMFRMIANLSGSHPENDPLIESKQLMRGIERVQRQVEGRNFDIRKHILEYDDVLNQHRLAIYARRNRILEGKDIHSDVVEMLENQIERVISLAYDGHSDIESDVAQNIVNAINDFAGAEIAKVSDYLDAENLEDLKRKTKNLLGGQIEMLRDTGSEEIFADFERRLTLAAIDELWMQHMDAMAHLREEVAFEGYAQKNPLVVYKERAYDSFVNMMSDIEYRVIKGLLTAKPQESIDAVELESALREDYIETGSEAVGVAHVPFRKWQNFHYTSRHTRDQCHPSF